MKLALYASLRRRLLYYFQPRYVKHMAKMRKGSCNGCAGICCKRTRKCLFLHNGKCRIYNRMPLFCRLFPVDEKDIELSGVKDVCRFYWRR